MADCYFPEVAEWFNQYGPEGAMHMMMGRIVKIEEQLAETDKRFSHGQPPPKQDKQADKEVLPKLS
jgi:hypothetical protein